MRRIIPSVTFGNPLVLHPGGNAHDRRKHRRAYWRRTNAKAKNGLACVFCGAVAHRLPTTCACGRHLERNVEDITLPELYGVMREAGWDLQITIDPVAIGD